MRSLKLLRCMLFVPANNWRLIQSAQQRNPDAVILDLEDAVPFQEKETARWFAKDAAGLLKAAGQNVIVRVNSLATGLTEEDLKFAINDMVDGIMLPKSESRNDIIELERLMEKREKNENLAKVAIIPLIESARGVVSASEISNASERVVAISFGAADFLRDFGRSYFNLSPNESELLYARSHLAICARAAGVSAIDTPFLGSITDKDGLIQESIIACQLGFKGKLCIHPMHIQPICQVFSPSKKDVDQARRIVEVYEQAMRAGLGATSLDGRMIDEATYKIAEETITTSEMINNRENTWKAMSEKMREKGNST